MSVQEGKIRGSETRRGVFGIRKLAGCGDSKLVIGGKGGVMR
jgi:hypothetical protein